MEKKPVVQILHENKHIPVNDIADLNQIAKILNLSDKSSFLRAMKKIFNGDPITGKQEANAVGEALKSLLTCETAELTKVVNKIKRFAKENPELSETEFAENVQTVDRFREIALDVLEGSTKPMTPDEIAFSYFGRDVAGNHMAHALSEMENEGLVAGSPWRDGSKIKKYQLAKEQIQEEKPLPKPTPMTPSQRADKVAEKLGISSAELKTTLAKAVKGVDITDANDKQVLKGFIETVLGAKKK